MVTHSLKRTIKFLPKALILALICLVFCFLYSPITTAQQRKNWDLDQESNYTLASSVEIKQGKAELKKNYNPGTDWIANEGSHSFGYRKKITVTNSSGDLLSNYQVKINLDTSGLDFGKTKSDGSDIRFTDLDKKTKLNYYTESWDSYTRKATIWVKIPEIPASSSQDIYMYYDNPKAPSLSSFDDTFTLSSYQDLMDSMDGLTDNYLSEITDGKLAIAQRWPQTDIDTGGNRFTAVGDGNNDEVNEVYGASSDGHIYQFKWDGSSWIKTDLGSGGSWMVGVAIGDGNNNGTNEVYAVNWDGHIYQFKWDGSSWIKTDLGSGGARMYGVAIGDGNNNGTNEVYAVNWDGHIYQFKWDGSSWIKTDVGSGGHADVAIGDGNNDGENEVYGACNDHHIYQFKWNGSSWIRTSVGVGDDKYQATSVAVGDGNNDGENEVYGATLVGNYIHQYKWDGSSSWMKTGVGSGGAWSGGIAIGDGNNDGVNEVYGASGQIYQFKWNGSSWIKINVGFGESTAVGDGNNDGENEVYGNTDGHIYQYKWDGYFAYYSNGHTYTKKIPEDKRIVSHINFIADQIKEENTQIKYKFQWYYEDWWEWMDIPDSDLPDNSAGFTSDDPHYVKDLSCLGSKYPQVRVYFELSTEDELKTPKLDGITLNYYTREYHDPEPTVSVSAHTDFESLYPTQVSKIYLIPKQGQDYIFLKSFSETLETCEGMVKYQITNQDPLNNKWYFYDSSQEKWVLAQESTSEANIATEIDDHIEQFEDQFGHGTFYYKAYLVSDGSQDVVLDKVSLRYLNDTQAPENPSLVQATGNNQELDDNNWYNYTDLEFSWPKACDLGQDCKTGGARDLPPSPNPQKEEPSGISGYFVYFGKDKDVDPETKGSFQDENPGGNSASFSLNPLDSGKTFYFRIKTKDQAGNISDKVDTLFVYKFDFTKPLPVSSLSHVPLGYTPKNEFTFTWEASSDLESGFQGYCYKTGDSSFTSDSTCGDGKFTTDTSISTKEDSQVKAYQDGQNIFYVRALDKANNFSDWISDIYYFAGKAPLEPQNLKVSPSSSESKPVSKNEFSFAWSKPLSYSSPISGYYYSINTLPSEYTATFTQDTSLASAPFATQQGKNTFYVVALDEVGNIDWTKYAKIDFYCKTKAPGQPKDPTITDASIRAKERYAITLMWSEPKEEGSGIASYIIERAEKKAKDIPGSQPIRTSANSARSATLGLQKNAKQALHSSNLKFTQIVAIPGTSTGYLDTNLDTNKVYYYQIKASDNAQAVSIASEQVGMKPEGRYTTPPTISNVKLEPQSFGAKVTWKTDRPTTSHVQFGKKSTEEKEQGVEELVEEHEITIVGLDPETTYLYRVKSKDRDENINYSDISTFKTLEAPKVSEVAVSDITLTGATISWKTNLITTSKIEYGATTDYGLLVYDVSESKVTSHTLKLESLSSGTTYHYRIGGVDLYGNTVLSDDYTFATPPYPEVISQTTENKEEGKTEVRWSTNVATTSEVEYWSEEGNIAPKTQGTTPKVIDHAILLFGLEDDTTYQFRLRGRDQFGNEAVSDTFTFHTLKDTTPPVITEVYSESNVLGYGEKQKVQIIVAWKTNEPASSKVYYGEGVTGEFPGQTEEFGDLVLEHLVVVSDLSPSKIYHFKVESFDKARNSSQSEIFTVLTSRKRESFLQLIVGVLEDTFSWVKNIKF